MDIFKNYESFWKNIIRPTRQTYNISDLGSSMILTKDTREKVKRHDFDLKNKLGLSLKCSFYEFSERNTPQPCVIYLHCNSGSRLEGYMYVDSLLNKGISVCIFDFAGSGQSDGEYISLGYFELGDVEVVIKYLKSNFQVSRIGIWGRSMGAVTGLMYIQNDQNIAAACFDSPFSNFMKLAAEIGSTKTGLPKFLIKGALSLIQSTIFEKAKFNIEDLDVLKNIDKSITPCQFITSKKDSFVKARHTEKIQQKYKGENKIIYFDGDHNEQRPVKIINDCVEFFIKYLLQKQPAPQNPENKENRQSHLKLIENQFIKNCKNEQIQKNTHQYEYESYQTCQNIPLSSIPIYITSINNQTKNNVHTRSSIPNIQLDLQKKYNQNCQESKTVQSSRVIPGSIISTFENKQQFKNFETKDNSRVNSFYSGEIGASTQFNLNQINYSTSNNQNIPVKQENSFIKREFVSFQQQFPASDSEQISNQYYLQGNSEVVSKQLNQQQQYLNHLGNFQNSKQITFQRERSNTSNQFTNDFYKDINYFQILNSDNQNQLLSNTNAQKTQDFFNQKTEKKDIPIDYSINNFIGFNPNQVNQIKFSIGDVKNNCNAQINSPNQIQQQYNINQQNLSEQQLPELSISQQIQNLMKNQCKNLNNNHQIDNKFENQTNSKQNNVNKIEQSNNQSVTNKQFSENQNRFRSMTMDFAHILSTRQKNDFYMTPLSNITNQSIINLNNNDNCIQSNQQKQQQFQTILQQNPNINDKSQKLNFLSRQSFENSEFINYQSIAFKQDIYNNVNQIKADNTNKTNKNSISVIQIDNNSTNCTNTQSNQSFINLTEQLNQTSSRQRNNSSISSNIINISNNNTNNNSIIYNNVSSITSLQRIGLEVNKECKNNATKITNAEGDNESIISCDSIITNNSTVTNQCSTNKPGSISHNQIREVDNKLTSNNQIQQQLINNQGRKPLISQNLQVKSYNKLSNIGSIIDNNTINVQTKENSNNMQFIYSDINNKNSILKNIDTKYKTQDFNIRNSTLNQKYLDLNSKNITITLNHNSNQNTYISPREKLYQYNVHVSNSKQVFNCNTDYQKNKSNMQQITNNPIINTYDAINNQNNYNIGSSIIKNNQKLANNTKLSNNLKPDNTLKSLNQNIDNKQDQQPSQQFPTISVSFLQDNGSQNMNSKNNAENSFSSGAINIDSLKNMNQTNQNQFDFKNKRSSNNEPIQRVKFSKDENISPYQHQVLSQNKYNTQINILDVSEKYSENNQQMIPLRNNLIILKNLNNTINLDQFETFTSKAISENEGSDKYSSFNTKLNEINQNIKTFSKLIDSSQQGLNTTINGQNNESFQKKRSTTTPTFKPDFIKNIQNTKVLQVISSNEEIFLNA